MSRWSDAAKRALVRPKTKDGTKYQYDSIFHYFTLWYIIDTLVPNIEICIKPWRNSKQILLVIWLTRVTTPEVYESQLIQIFNLGL